MPTSTKAAGPALELPGIWTPWAACLCAACHGPTLFGGSRNRPVPDYARLLLPTVAGDGEALGYCCWCAAAIWLPGDVALLQTLVDHLNGAASDLAASLAQTGGMNVGVEVQGLSGGRFAALAVDDAEDVLVAAVYASDAAYLEGDEPSAYAEGLADAAAVLAFLLAA
jgi:hypothetical protein